MVCGLGHPAACGARRRRITSADDADRGKHGRFEVELWLCRVGREQQMRNPQLAGDCRVRAWLAGAEVSRSRRCSTCWTRRDIVEPARLAVREALLAAWCA